MKTLEKLASRSAISAITVTLLWGVPLVAQAQTVPTDLANAAEEACKSSAVAKGFQVVDVVSITPKSGTADGADVVLNLTRDGQPFKLTCGYSKTAGAAIGESSTATTAPALAPTTAPVPATTTTTTDTGFPWWWLLIPILGIPLLALLFKKDRPVATPTGTARTYVAPKEAIVRGYGNSVNVYSGPGTTYQVSGSLRDGQRVTLSNQTSNDWSQLADGGWIPTSSLELASGYTTR
jgi:hypothetical protein